MIQRWDLQLLKQPFQALPWRNITSSRPMHVQLFVRLCRHEVPEQTGLKNPSTQRNHRPSDGTPCAPSSCEHTQAATSAGEDLKGRPAVNSQADELPSQQAAGQLSLF
ncbi:TPA: hypothetical protein ACH3X3_009669 [Trebouxia sp. C0006]